MRNLLNSAPLLFLVGCGTSPEPVDSALPLTLHTLKTTLVSEKGRTSTLHVNTAQLDDSQTMLTGTAITAQLAADKAPTITLTAPHAQWDTTSKQLTATGVVTASHDAGWLQAQSATCDTQKQTLFLKGPVESVLRIDSSKKGSATIP